MTLKHWHFYFAIWKHSYLCLRRILQKVFATSLIICGKKKSLQEDNQWLLIDNWIINYCYELDNQWLLIVNWKRIMNYSQLDIQWLLIANWAQQQNGHFRELLVNPGNFVTQALRRFLGKLERWWLVSSKRKVCVKFVMQSLPSLLSCCVHKVAPQNSWFSPTTFWKGNVNMKIFLTCFFLKIFKETNIPNPCCGSVCKMFKDKNVTCLL